MIATIFIGILVIIALIAIGTAVKVPEFKGPAIGVLVVALVLGLGTLGISTLYQQSVGQAKVIVNAGGTIAGEDDTPGWGVKAPWQSTVDWDLFSQTLTFAGNKEDGAPSYTGGQVSGYEITSSVARGAQTDLDVQVVYNLDGEKVAELYKQFRSQERFTKQVIEPKVLSVIRTVPTQYTPVEFRGEKRGEATKQILDGLNSALNPYGISVSQVNLQSIRYTDQVEDSIKAVEVAQQKESEAQANLRATQVSAQAQVVEAEAAADALRAAAQGQADANATLAKSLTPQVLQQRYIDALGKGTVFVVPEGSTPLVTTGK